MTKVGLSSLVDEYNNAASTIYFDNSSIGETIRQFLSDLEGEKMTVEKKPSMDGRNVVVILAP